MGMAQVHRMPLLLQSTAACAKRRSAPDWDITLAKIANGGEPDGVLGDRDANCVADAREVPAAARHMRLSSHITQSSTSVLCTCNPMLNNRQLTLFRLYLSGSLCAERSGVWGTQSAQRCVHSKHAA